MVVLKLEIIDLSAQRVLLDHFLCIESTIWGPKSVPIKRAAKTIMLHTCDIENCEDTPATIYGGERKFRKNDE